MSAPTERCVSCGGNHPAGCAYKGASIGVEWDCPTCASRSFEVVSTGGDGSCRATVIECPGGHRWELLQVLSALPRVKETA